MYLGSTEIKKICLGSEEVKKVYQGSNLIWENAPTPYTFDFRNSSITDVPSYIDYSGLYTTTDRNTGLSVYSNAWYYRAGYYLRSIGATAPYADRNGWIQIKKQGKYKITLSYNIPERYGTSSVPAMKVYDGIKVYDGSSYLSSNLRIDKNAGTVSGVVSYTANVNTDDFYLNFFTRSNYQTGPEKNYYVYIYYIKIEPI